uniref:Uncharacterized protein n=1 Tax=Neogobius melanostomus TaxID=47308 RepID=A0A8C6U9E6_9GOBI
MQPPMAQSRLALRKWLLAGVLCFSSGCYGFWCGPCLTCTVSGRMKECYCLPLCDICVLGWGCVRPAAYGLRVALRHKYKIKGSLPNDLCVSCCCTSCSWCQMHRELKLRNTKPTVISIQNVSTLHL